MVSTDLTGSGAKLSFELKWRRSSDRHGATGEKSHEVVMLPLDTSPALMHDLLKVEYQGGALLVILRYRSVALTDHESSAIQR